MIDKLYPLDNPENAKRIALGVSYCGAKYFGWQAQHNPAMPSVQAQLEDALEKIAQKFVRVTCAGRTDSRVHGTGQVVHFDTDVERPLKAWVKGVNTHLPPDIRVNWARVVDRRFHARFAATARRYQYWIQNTEIAPIFHDTLTHVYEPLDEQKMHRAAQALLGENDFSSFRAAACQSNTAMRNVHEVSVKRFGDKVCIDIQANAFLLHMVRNIVGALVEVGAGRLQVEWIAWLLAQQDRTLAPATAKPYGLYLINVVYPEEILPVRSILYPFIPSDC